MQGEGCLRPAGIGALKFPEQVLETEQWRQTSMLKWSVKLVKQSKSPEKVSLLLVYRINIVKFITQNTRNPFLYFVRKQAWKLLVSRDLLKKEKEKRTVPS